MLFISREEALEAGMTHHGRIFGVPAWVCDTEDGLDACPKFVPAVAWCWLADKLYEIATWFMPSDCYLEAPLRVLEPITTEGAGYA